MNAKSRRWIGKIALTMGILVMLWLLIFEIPLTFTPLRSTPDAITVYRRGEQVTLDKNDGDFSALYRLLRNAGKGTIAHLVSHDLIMDSHKCDARFFDQNWFGANAAVVVLRYASVQQGRLPGSTGAPYDEVVFVMDVGDSTAVRDIAGDESIVLYRQIGSLRQYSCFKNYGSLDKAADYVEQMDFGAAE